ncbi:MAG: nitrophenyl compound nitroreductase subunit ArsF family protein [Fibrobacterota bacterium]
MRSNYKVKQLMFYFLVLLIGTLFLGCSQSDSKKQADTAVTQIKSTTADKPSGFTADATSNQLVVYYFMSNYRCPSCMYIEKTTESVVTTTFAEYVKSGRVVFKAVNIDEPENKHYDTDYKLYAQSVILSEVKNGKELRWTNLDKVWKLLNNDAEFKAYVTKEIKTYLGES